MKTEQQIQDALDAIKAGKYQGDAPPAWKAGAIAVLEWVLRAED